MIELIVFVILLVVYGFDVLVVDGLVSSVMVVFGNVRVISIVNSLCCVVVVFVFMDDFLWFVMGL